MLDDPEFLLQFYTQPNNHTRILIAALDARVKNWKTFQSPSIAEYRPALWLKHSYPG
jgi:hypothetical protein